MLSLTVSERRDLKARAHALSPIVMIGNAGLTEAVLKEIAASLKIHELIKIKVMSDERAQREAMLEAICTRLDAAPVQPSADPASINPIRRARSSSKMPRHRQNRCPRSSWEIATREREERRVKG
jgi:putative YhbY family RNA-binding protein